VGVGDGWGGGVDVWVGVLCFGGDRRGGGGVQRATALSKCGGTATRGLGAGLIPP